MGSGRLLGEAFAHRGSNVFEELSVDFISSKIEHQ